MGFAVNGRIDHLQGVEIPIFIWYENYLHTGEGYEGRVSRVSQQPGSSSHFGLASLNLTRIRETDQGWYSCLVNFLNRSPRQDKNGTLFHLNVHGTVPRRRACSLKN